MNSICSHISTRCILIKPMVHTTFFFPVDALLLPLLSSLANIPSKMSLQWVVCQGCELWCTKPKRLMKKHGLHSSIQPLSLHPARLALLYLFCLITLNEYGSNSWHHHRVLRSCPALEMQRGNFNEREMYGAQGKHERIFQWSQTKEESMGGNM